MARRPAVFLDRDGTMIHEAGYLSKHADLRWFSWTPDAVRLLNRAGFRVCVTTNQGGIGLNLFTEAFMHDLHARMTKTLEAAGAHIDGWFYCPHHPSAIVESLRVVCECRKPKAGLIRRAVELLDIDLGASFVVGDRASDVGMAQAAKLPAVLVRTGHGEEYLATHGGEAPGTAFVAADLMEATSWILARSGHPLDVA